MVSLTAVEALASGLWPENLHVVVNLPDPRKGEQLVLVTDREAATARDLQAWARQQGATELMVPKTVLTVDRVPILGTGKTDFVAARGLAAQQVLGESAA